MRIGQFTEVVGYSGAHYRVSALRGRAVQYACVDCGTCAHEWSYTGTDPHEMQSSKGPYSTNAAFYVPRCRPCHRQRDGASRIIPPSGTCKHGHLQDEANTRIYQTKSGLTKRACKPCEAAATSRYKARKRVKS